VPHLTLPIGQGGPVLDIVIGVSQARQNALTANKQPVPPSVRIRGLVDTGASCTCVDPSILASLQLSPTGTTTMHTPSTGASPGTANLYDASIVLVHPQLSLTFFNQAVAESVLAVQGIHALIGRDILAKCLLTYDGQSKLFILAF